MRDVVDTVNAVLERGGAPVSEEFTELSVRWSEFCLRNLIGETLKRGLRLAIALREFQDEFPVPKEKP